MTITHCFKPGMEAADFLLLCAIGDECASNATLVFCLNMPLSHGSVIEVILNAQFKDCDKHY